MQIYTSFSKKFDDPTVLYCIDDYLYATKHDELQILTMALSRVNELGKLDCNINVYYQL